MKKTVFKLFVVVFLCFLANHSYAITCTTGGIPGIRDQWGGNPVPYNFNFGTVQPSRNIVGGNGSAVLGVSLTDSWIVGPGGTVVLVVFCITMVVLRPA